MRTRFFDGALFADPAWDMLLDLTASRAEHVRVSVTSLCIASGVPPTTALRWISQMVDVGLFVRTEDGVDKRRAFIALSDHAAEAMARYFAELGRSEEHTSELQSLMRISYAVFCLIKKNTCNNDKLS